jgi:hypothetical protein
MSELISNVSKMLSDHWPFFAVMFTFMLVGQVNKTVVFTKHRAEKSHGKVIGHFWWWGRKTLSLHLAILGGLTGLLWQNPVDGVEGIISSIGYFAFAGAMSVWGYQILKGLAKKKGIDLTLPGTESVPPKTNGSK